MDIRQLPQQDDRVETGPVQFGDDWPGVFIRGDNAAYYAMVLRTFIEGGYGAQEGVIAQVQLRGLQELLAGAIVGPVAGMVKLPSNNCWESIREAMDGAGIVDPKRMIPHLVVDALLSGWRDGAISGRDHKIQVTRIYGARGADVFAEGVLSTKGDLIKIEGSRDLELIPDEAARIGKELIRLARINGWIDQEEDDGK